MANLKKIILLAGDLIILYLSLVITLFIRYGGLSADKLKDHLGPFSLIFFIWILVFYLKDLYRYQILRDPYYLLKNIFIAIVIAGVISAVAFYLFSQFFELTPKTNLFIFCAVFFILNYLWRSVTLKIFYTGAINTLVLGDSPLIRETVAHLEKNPQIGYRVIQWLKEEINHGAFENIKKILKEQKINLIIIPNHITKDSSALKLVYKLLPFEVALINFWNFYELIFEKIPLEELEEGWFIENIKTRRKFYDTVKRGLDFFLALVLSVSFLPFAIIIGLFVKITSPGPAIYKQKRIGKNEKAFTTYKFRTMRENSGGPLWTESRDPRLTAVGKILRFTHLDEVPQLWNILKGDLSFTGPRPERIELVEQYKNFPYYEMRHIIKPGLSGWAQINYKPSASLEEAQEKLRYDIFYIKNRSFFLDLVIILKTIRYIFISYAA